MAALTYHITMGTGFALSIDAGSPNPGSQLILDHSSLTDAYQTWELIFYAPTQASILFNPKTGLYAAPKSLAEGAPVILFTVPGNFVFDGAHTWQVVGTPPYAVRAQANENRNLNASGSGNWGVGTPIIVYTWSGGANNEIWNLRMQKA